MKDFQLQANTTNLPVLIIFTTPTCAPCKIVQHTFGREIPYQKYILVDAEQEWELAGYYNITSVPTTILFLPNRTEPIRAMGSETKRIVQGLRLYMGGIIPGGGR